MLPKDRGGPTFLTTVRSLAKSVMAEVRNPKWTSYGALEIDVFARSRADFSVLLATVEPLARIEFSRDLNVAPLHRTKEALVAEARQYFNSERYWEAHESLETLWRGAEGEEKSYLQGLILVCAGFVHHQKGEDQVAHSLLRRAAKQLSYGIDPYYGIQVESLKKHVNRIVGSGRFEVFRA